MNWEDSTEMAKLLDFVQAETQKINRLLRLEPIEAIMGARVRIGEVRHLYQDLPPRNCF